MKSSKARSSGHETSPPHSAGGVLSGWAGRIRCPVLCLERHLSDLLLSRELQSRDLNRPRRPLLLCLGEIVPVKFQTPNKQERDLLMIIYSLNPTGFLPNDVLMRLKTTAFQITWKTNQDHISDLFDGRECK